MWQAAAVIVVMLTMSVCKELLEVQPVLGERWSRSGVWGKNGEPD
jgi:hypothetical protein